MPSNMPAAGRSNSGVVGGKTPQAFVISVRDKGPGIANLPAILAGLHKSATGMGLGLLGAQRLMDEFHIDTQAGRGTTVRLGKSLPPRAPPVTASALKSITEKLAADGPPDAMAEIRQQNQQILVQMDQLKDHARRIWKGSIRNCRIPIAAWSRCTPNWMSAPTICAARTS